MGHDNRDKSSGGEYPFLYYRVSPNRVPSPRVSIRQSFGLYKLVVQWGSLDLRL